MIATAFPVMGERRHGVIAPNEDCSGSHRDSGSRSEDDSEQTLVVDQPSANDSGSTEPPLLQAVTARPQAPRCPGRE